MISLQADAVLKRHDISDILNHGNIATKSLNPQVSDSSEASICFKFHIITAVELRTIVSIQNQESTDYHQRVHGFVQLRRF